MIIVHRTGNSGTTAEANRDYFESLNHPPLAGKIYASAHYIVDADQIIRCIPETERAHHCIGANHFAIGIETCEPLQQGTYQNLLDLIHDICTRYGFSATKDYIQPHSKYDPVNRHFDPFYWNDFLVGKTNPGKDLFDPIRFYNDLGR
jgi:N-acetylmuramoyl-L-alanine amidase CwlA